MGMAAVSDESALCRLGPLDGSADTGALFFDDLALALNSVPETGVVALFHSVHAISVGGIEPSLKQLRARSFWVFADNELLFLGSALLRGLRLGVLGMILHW
jgi:hypothetical protein